MRYLFVVKEFQLTCGRFESIARMHDCTVPQSDSSGWDQDSMAGLGL